MGLFRDTEEMYEIYASLFDLLGRDSRIGLRLANAGLVVRFRLSDPDGMVTLNMRDKPMRNHLLKGAILPEPAKFQEMWGSLRVFIIANPQWFLL
jgi:hypothetical protein